MKVLSIAALLFVTFAANAQEAERKFVQFIINGPLDRGAVYQMDRDIRSEDGIVMSRTDFPSKSYFAIFESSSNITKADFEAWMKKWNLTVAHYREGVRGKDRIIDMNANMPEYAQSSAPATAQ